MWILKSSKSKALVASNENSKNPIGEIQTKERQKKRRGKITKKGTQKGHHLNKINNKASLLLIPKKMGILIRKRRIVPIVKELVMMNINFITSRLMN